MNDDMVAEGQITEEEELIDDLVEVATTLKKKGYVKQDIYKSLIERKGGKYSPQRWRYLVNNAMEYIS